MKRNIPVVIICICSLNLFGMHAYAQKIARADALEQAFLHPPTEAKPWIYWYWMQDAVSKEGIVADLHSMKAEGIAGAYLMPIKGPANPPFINPPVVQLTKPWWAMVKFAM